MLEQMSDRTVRETVAGIVSQVAERLVREEIERIKSSHRLAALTSSERFANPHALSLARAERRESARSP